MTARLRLVGSVVVATAFAGAIAAAAEPAAGRADVPHSRSAVRGNDPHAFEGDGDGVGCEG